MNIKIKLDNLTQLKKEALKEFYIFLKLKNKSWLYPIVLLVSYFVSITDINKNK